MTRNDNVVLPLVDCSSGCETTTTRQPCIRHLANPPGDEWVRI